MASDPPNDLSIGLSLSYFDYAEELTPPLKSTESGPVLSLEGGYCHQFGEGSPWVSASASFSSSNTTFDGSTNSPVVPIVSTTMNQFLRAEARVGIPFGSFSPYAGYGYRYWLRRLDYDEYYSWSFLIAGIRAMSDWGFIAADLRAGLDGSVRPTLNGQLRLENYEPGVEPTTLELKSRVGCHIEAPIEYRISPAWTLSLTPWYEYSAIGGSDRVTLYKNGAPYTLAREPSSRTHQYGSGLAAHLRF